MTAKCICYIGNSIGGTRFRDKMHDMEIEGNILHQFRTIMNFFTRNLRSNQARQDGNQAERVGFEVVGVSRGLTKREADIRNFCSVPRTAQEIMDRLNITNQSKNRLKYITSLIELGVLERTIPEKPNDPNQKYRRKN